MKMWDHFNLGQSYRKYDDNSLKFEKNYYYMEDICLFHNSEDFLYFKINFMRYKNQYFTLYAYNTKIYAD